MFATLSQNRRKKKIRTIYKKYNKIKTRKYNMNTSIKMGCTHHWNEIKHLILKEIQLQRAIIFFEKQKKKVSINTKVLCQCPVKSLTCHILINFLLE